jgi:hypothetical protein
MRRKLVASLIGGAFLACSAAAISEAADLPPTNPNILAALQQLQATLDSLTSGLGSLSSNIQTALTNLQTSVTAIETDVSNLAEAAAGNVLVTPPVFLTDGAGIACTAVNVSSTAKHVQAKLIRGSFQLNTLINQSVDPGQSTGGSVFPGAASIYYCRFTVSDGTKNDIRAAVQVFPTSGAVDGPVVAAQ